MTELYVLGKVLKKDERAVAVVGSRAITERGRKLTVLFTKALVDAGYTIVSGLARGVDTVAHETALKFKGRTIAVLGSGTNIIYPPENKELANKIIKQGAVVSGFLPDTKPLPENFLARNKIIAGFAKAVLVIEGARRSGTLSTAAHAATLGIEVFAVPGSPATDYLIKEGAGIANSPKDILQYLSKIESL